MAPVRSASQNPARKKKQGPSGTDDLSPQSSARSRVRPHVSNERSVSTVASPPVFPLRYREITNAIMHDQGGPDRCSETRQQLIKRFAAAAVLAEQMEAQLARGETIDVKDHALLCSIMVNIARVLGRDQTAQHVSSVLAKYLELKAQEEEPDDTPHRPLAGPA